MDAQDRGWGPGWPNCQEQKWVAIGHVDGVPDNVFDVARVHEKVAELVRRLIAESARRGYVFKDGQCWGAVCRAIRGSTLPSNHSWGLALDFNSARNPLGSDPDDSDIPDWMVELWADYGFFWGGFFGSRPDPMHFEFVKTPKDAEALTKRARDEGLGEDMALTPEQENLLQYLKGFKKFFDGGPEPANFGPAKEGWNDARKTTILPKPE